VASAKSSGLAKSRSPAAATKLPGVSTGSDGIKALTEMPWACISLATAWVRWCRAALLPPYAIGPGRLAFLYGPSPGMKAANELMFTIPPPPASIIAGSTSCISL
jgi:hypothetical protein